MTELPANDPASPGSRVRAHTRRRLILWLVLPLAILLGADTLLWRFTETQLESGFADWLAANRAAGWTIAAGTPTRTGWPLEAALAIPDLSLSGGDFDLPGGMAWHAARVVLRINPLHPATLAIEAQGPQGLRLADAPEIPYTAGRVEADFPLQADTPTPGSQLVAENIRINPDTLAATLTLARLSLYATLNPTPAHGAAAVSFTADATDIGLPPPPARGSWALGDHVAALSVAGALIGNPPAVAGVYARAAAWRNDGGALQLRRLSLNWGQLDLSGSATLGLDGHMQPTGDADAHVVNPMATLDALEAGRVITPNAAGAARAVLGLLMQTPENGAAPQIDMKVTLRDRTLAVSRFPLLKLPELVWPDGP